VYIVFMLDVGTSMRTWCTCGLYADHYQSQFW